MTLALYTSLIFATASLATPPVEAPAWPQGRVLVQQPFQRPSGQVAYATVYLPPSYDREPTARFPVLILLHGLAGASQDWLDRANLPALVDEAIARRRIKPMIVVMPDGGEGYWVDWPDGDPANRYGSLVEPELREWTDSTFRTNGRRAIGGLSMGGFGALSIALRHRQQYQAAISLSGALFTRQPTGRSIYLAAFGYPGIHQARFSFVNPLDLIQFGLADGLPIWLDCGSDDRRKFTQGLRRTSRALRKAGVRHVARFRPGRHEWPVWVEGLTESLRWVNRHL